jgi:uncharacterized protein
MLGMTDRSARWLRIENVTRGTMVAERCRVARGLRERIFGLHLWPELETGEGLLLPGATSIDTTFMRYVMDAVFVDGEARVTKVVHDMRPWRMAWFARGAKDCIELPAGAARASATEEGDELLMTPIKPAS